MTDYVEIDLKDMNKAELEVVNAVINEGRMRRNEEVLEKIERRITEAYAENNRELIDFLEDLIVDLDLDL